MMRVDTQTIFGNLQCRKFNYSSCRCLYHIKIFVVAFFSDLSQYNSAAAVICVRVWVLLCTYFSTYHDQASTGFFLCEKECLLKLHRRGSTVRPNLVSQIIVFRKLVFSLITVSDTSRQSELTLASSMPNGRQPWRKTVQIEIGSSVLLNMPHQILQGACKQI